VRGICFSTVSPRRLGYGSSSTSRICSHYFAHDAFLQDGVLIREAGIPGILIHGRNDLGGGASTPWELASAWPGAELIIIEDSGHTGRPP
jgi:proline iminopeptidase